MIILQAGAERGRHRQPFADVHRIVALIVVTPVSEFSSVSPIVLNHIDPPSKNSHSDPHHQRELQASDQPPDEIKSSGLRNNCKYPAPRDPEGTRFQNVIAGEIFLAPIRQETKR